VEHPIQDSSLERFAAGTASREEACAITRHLLKGCPQCAARLRELIRPPVEEADYGPVVDAFVRVCLGRPKKQEGGKGEGVAACGALSPGKTEMDRPA